MARSEIIAFASAESRKRLERASPKAAFFELAPHFQPQPDKYTCALACASILLNALRPKPGHPFSPLALLGPTTDRIKNRKALRGKKAGFTLQELAKLLRHFRLRVGEHPASASRIEGSFALRNLARNALGRGRPLLLANFSYEVLLGSGGGHFSPLAAYDEISDSLLVLDVANHRTLWYWAPTELLYLAMNNPDPVAQAPRGWLEVSLPVKYR